MGPGYTEDRLLHVLNAVVGITEDAAGALHASLQFGCLPLPLHQRGTAGSRKGGARQHFHNKFFRSGQIGHRTVCIF